MIRRIAGAGLVAVLICLWAVPAEAAGSRPLRLTAHSVDIGPPLPPPALCDEYVKACGVVSVTTTFSGLNGRARPVTEPGNPDGDVSGSARVVRRYGCQDAAGKHLTRYDRWVVGHTPLVTPHGFGFTVPRQGDSFTVTTYYPLFDNQPGNCPTGTRAMVYGIRVSCIQLDLVSLRAPIPNAHYSVRGTTVWRGAVPTPTPVPVATVN